MKIVYKTFNIPIYYGTLHVIISDSFSEANKKFKLGISDDYLVGYSALVDRFGPIDAPLQLFILIKPETTLTIIAHESTHIVSQIFLHTGVKGDFNNDEPLAYMYGWVFKTIAEVFMNDLTVNYK